MKALTAVMAFALFVVPAGLANARPSEDALFRRWIVQYLKNEYRADPDLQDLVYGYALVDLNGDGQREAVVWANDGHCGTSGCDLEILSRDSHGWRLVGTSSVGTRLPIKILSSRTGGWHDLAAWQAGGGVMRPFEGRFRFNPGNQDGEYELVEPKDWTGVNPRPPRLYGRILIRRARIRLPKIAAPAPAIRPSRSRAR